MPLPKSDREKRIMESKKENFLQEINQTWEDKGYIQPEPMVSPEFLQEINEPVHEEVLVEEKPKRTRRTRSSK